MGKIAKTIKQNHSQKCKHVLQHSLKKPVPQVSLKRLLMLQRRLNTLLNEQSSWETKNKELLESLKVEKMRNASLRKDSFQWQRLYHESMITTNTLKVKQTEMVQVMSACLREIESTYPHIVAFSEAVTSSKIRISNVLISLSSGTDYENLPRHFQDNGKVNGCDSVKKNEKPMKHRVGPMVRGQLIRKPKIMLERLMLPQPREQESVNTVLSGIEVDNQLTPIAEENEHEEDARLRHISMRPKRKLGTWRVRRQEKVEKDREREERTNKSPSAVAYDDDSTDTESNPTAINHMEPCFKGVSCLLQNSSLLKVDAARTVDGEGGGSNIVRQSKPEVHHLAINSMPRASEDPLEGSSWMYNNSYTNFQSHNIERQSSLYKSDSFDDDDENLIPSQNNTASLSPQNTLVVKDQSCIPSQKGSNNSLSIESIHNTSNNTDSPTVRPVSVSSPIRNTQTFIVKQNKSRNSSMSVESSHGTLSGSPTAEPDSTNNIDIHLLNNFSFKNSLDNVSRSFSSSCESIDRSYIPSKNKSVENNSANKMQSSQRISIKTNSLTVRLSKVPDISTSFSSKSSSSPSHCKKRSSYCNNCTPPQSPEIISGKRIRKPKKNLYPGEEITYLPSPSKNKISKQRGISTRKPTNGNKKSKKSFAKKRRSSDNSSNSTVGGTAIDCSSKTTKEKKESGGRLTVNQIQKSKLSGSKKSIQTPRNSSICGIQNSQDNESAHRPKRTRVAVSYKESPLNLKQRRP